MQVDLLKEMGNGHSNGTDEPRPSIHPTAIIHPSAEIGPEVTIGPFCVIGARARIGARTRLAAHVSVDQDTTVGEDCQVFQGTVLGGPPQDWGYRGERSYLYVGNRNIIREYVTIHRATGDGAETRVGDDNMIMAYCHIGHNCSMGSGIT